MVEFGPQELEKKVDYDRIVKEFGAEYVNPTILEKLASRGELHNFLKTGYIYAHRDFDKFLEKSFKGEKVAIVSGRGPSNHLHIGHLMLFNFNKWLQDVLNTTIYIPLSDDEKYVFGKVRHLKDAWKFGIENAIDIIALGFKKGKTFFYFSTQLKEVYELSVRLSRHLTFNTIRATFGLDLSANAGIVFYTSVQAAHILLPEYLNNEYVIVPIAIDQDPYMRLTRDIAEGLNLEKPAALYSKYVTGLTGQPMSASIPETSIFITDDEKTIRHKIWNALTGGRATIKEQRKLGGEPDKCIVFEWLKLFVFKDRKESEEHKRKCLSGELLCGECKKMLTNYMIKVLREHWEKREKIKDEIEDYFLHDLDKIMKYL